MVDDSSTPEGAELRDRFARELATDVADVSKDCDAIDPAAWAPTDRIAIVAYASRPVDSWATPTVLPELGLRTNQKTASNLKQWGDALAASITFVPDEPPARFQPLSRLSETLSLLGGLREPVDAAEEALLATGRDVTQVEVSLVTAHEDDSSADAAAYPLRSQLGTLKLVSLVDAILPSISGGDCGGVRQYSERFTAWLSNVEGALPHAWAAGDTCPLRTRFPIACAPRCFAIAPRLSNEGIAACHVYAETIADPCPEQFGWVEASKASLESAGLDSPHYCEVRQLTGTDLQRCRDDLQCEDCDPGFCITTIPELSSACTDANATALPRFIGGAARGAEARLHVVCNSADR